MTAVQPTDHTASMLPRFASLPHNAAGDRTHHAAALHRRAFIALRVALREASVA